MNKLAELIRKGKIKRSLRARQKLDYPGLVSHVTQRATGKEPLFLEENDYLYMLGLIKENALKYRLRDFAFALMLNHVHILLRQQESNLCRAMQSLFTRYAIYFNRKYSRKGHVFCGRFRQAACFDDHYLVAASIYIHLNPVRAGIVSNYCDYRWTSWRLYCYQSPPVTFIEMEFILSMIDPDRLRSREKYRELLRKVALYPLKEALEDKRAIGKFGTWLKRRFPDLLTEKKEGNLPFPPGGGYVSDSELESIISNLRAKKRLLRPEDKDARRFAAEQLKARGFSPEEIAEYLSISRVTVFRIMANKT